MSFRERSRGFAVGDAETTIGEKNEKKASGCAILPSMKQREEIIWQRKRK